MAKSPKLKTTGASKIIKSELAKKEKEEIENLENEKVQTQEASIEEEVSIEPTIEEESVFVDKVSIEPIIEEESVFVDKVSIEEEVSVELAPAKDLPIIAIKEKSYEKEKLIEKFRKKMHDGTITDGEAAQLRTWLTS